MLRHGYFNSRTGHLSPMAGKAMSAQQELDQRFSQAVEAARQEILDGLTLAEYLRRTGTEDDLDEWSELLAQFGID